jgi:hypothetical protein
MTDDTPLLYLPPTFPRERAEAKLPLRSLRPPFIKSPLTRVEVCYLPHYLFRLDLRAGKKQSSVEAMVDGITGHFAHWKADAHRPIPADQDFEFGFALGVDEARKKLLEQYRWVLIQNAVKMRALFQPAAVALTARVYYPFWVGYFKAQDQWRFETLDALSGMRQGGKVRDALMAAWVGRKLKDKS